MNLFIKIILFTFPFVLAIIFFWPMAEKHFELSDEHPFAERTSPSDFVKPSSTYKEIPPSPKKIAKPQVEPPPQAETGIYRWVDENGRVVYSDRPIHKDAVAHTPKQLGYISATGIPKPTEVIRKQVVGNTSETETVSIKEQSPPEFKFSNTSATQKHGYVLLTGRISGGFACEQLRVVAMAESDRGRSVRDVDTVSYNGFGSALYEMKPHSGWNSGRRPHWQPTGTWARCVSP